MIRKLCVRSLQHGVGSMDHIYSLVIMEDEDDSYQEDDGADQCTPLDPETMLGGASLPAHNPEPPSPSETSLPWCKDNLELTYWNAALSQSIEAFNYVNCTWIDIKYTCIISWLKSSHCSSCSLNFSELFLCVKKTEQYCLEGYIFHLVKCAIVYQVLRVATHWKLDLFDFALNLDNIKRQVKPQAPK